MRTLYVTGRADDARGEKLLASGSDDANDSPNDVPYDHRIWNMGTTTGDLSSEKGHRVATCGRVYS